MSQSHRLIKAFLRQPVDKTPVWLMRQAGRYLPEYRALRKKAGDFMTLCKTPELACEVTLQPLKRFPLLDGAILFSDILTIPDAMGMGLYFVENEGPKFTKMIENHHDIKNLPIPDPEHELQYVMNAVRLIKKTLTQTPLLGFAGSPWTLATYMIANAKKMLYQSPEILHELLNKLADSIILYLNAQIKAGVNAVMIFDTWGGILSTPDYKAFSLYYMKKIIAGLTRYNNQEKIPCIIFTKHGGQWLTDMLSTDCDAIGLDWTTDLGHARQLVGHKVALQGNVDPILLYTNPDCIYKAVKNTLASYGNYPGHVFNLGHGVPKDVPVENVDALITAVHELSGR